MNTRKGEEAFFAVLWDNDLWMEIKRHMYVGIKSSTWDNYTDGDAAASQNYNSLIRSKSLKYTSYAMDIAAHNGNLEMVEFLHHAGNSCTKKAITWAASQGHKEVVEFLYENRLSACSPKTVDGAVIGGWVDIAEYLLSRGESCTNAAAVHAARVGDFDLIVLIFNMVESGIYPEDVVVSASANGCLKILKWMEGEGYETFSEEALAYAKARGQKRVVKYMENLAECYSQF